MTASQHPRHHKRARCRSLSESSTRLPDRAKVGEDVIREYQLRPITGQMSLAHEHPAAFLNLRIR